MSDAPEMPGSSSDPGQAAPETDWKARYTGASKKIESLQRALDKKQGELDNAVSQSESQLHDTAKARTDAEARAIALQAERDQLKAEHDKAVQRLAALESREANRKVVAEKHPALLPHLDDLRERSQFASDDEYFAYLSRMQQTFKVGSPDYPVGGTPSAPAAPPSLPGTNGKPRSAVEINQLLWNLDHDDPKNQQLIQQLYRELNALPGHR